jgi:hypothetical protein
MDDSRGIAEQGEARVSTIDHPGQTLIGDKNYFGRAIEADLTGQQLVLLRPVREARPGAPGSTCSGRCGRSSSR